MSENPLGKISNPDNSLILSGDVKDIASIFNRGIKTANDMKNKMVYMIVRDILNFFILIPPHQTPFPVRRFDRKCVPKIKINPMTPLNKLAAVA